MINRTKRQVFTSLEGYENSALRKFPQIDEDLNHISKESFKIFHKKTIKKIFNSVFPIISTNKNRRIELKKIEVGKSKLTFEEVRNRLGSYEFPVNILLELTSIQKDEIINGKILKSKKNLFFQWIEQKLNITTAELVEEKKKSLIFKVPQKNVRESLILSFEITKQVTETLYFNFQLRKVEELYFGSYPQISKKGTFLINGVEKVVVLQLVRSPGVFSSVSSSTSEYETYKAEIIPKQGTWIDFLTRVNRRRVGQVYEFIPTFEILIDKSKTHNILVSNIFTLFGFSEEYARDFFNEADEIVNSYASINYQPKKDDAIKTIYAKLFENINISVESKYQILIDSFFSRQKFFLSDVGRYKVNQKLFLGNLLYERILAEDLIDHKTKKIVFSKGTWIGKKQIRKLDQFLKNDNCLVTLAYDRTLISGTDRLQMVKVFADNKTRTKVVKVFGVDPKCQDETLTVPDMMGIISHVLNLSYDIGKVDDIDSLGNRNIHLIEELMEDQFRIGLKKIIDETNRKINDMLSSKYNHRIVSLINFGPLANNIRDFFNVSPLSQFFDQTNPLTELSNKRRITVLGEGGLKRANASTNVRDVHYSYLGKICPIETPEGPNIGLISNLSYFASINKWKFIETPYWKVINGKVIGEVQYLSTLEEMSVVIAPPTTRINSDGSFTSKKITVYFRDQLIEVDANDVEYLTYSPSQMFSVSAAAIPFLENNDANRALMGANMQKQAVPLIDPHSPIVGTGVEKQIARDSGFSIVSEYDGEIVYADSDHITLKTKEGSLKNYNTSNFLPSNQRTALFHRVFVEKGDQVKTNDILADGSSIEKGELALGQDLLVGFTTWKGFNYEDALIISDRLVVDDVFTSLHVEEYEIRRMRTKLGDEEFTSEVVNASEKARRLLDSKGIVLLGSEVGPGDILVGKVTPKDKGQRTPEDILLNQLFKGREQPAENNSLVVPTGMHGIVQDIKHYREKDLKETLSSEVIEVIKIFIAKKIPIKEGDKLASRHGNKGVVSRILPRNSMPYMKDGRSLDIMINPLGVPSRMNVGQLLEMHFGYAAKKLGIKIACPVFIGPNSEQLQEIMKKAGHSPTGKEILYDGETGEKFDQPIAIGLIYYMKLSHMVESKIHSREIGPYTLVTQQPLKGKAKNGGQRFGEMEVWALESYGAAYNLRELLTIKSDDIKGRNAIYQMLINDKPRIIDYNYFPESFNVLMSEMRSLCLNLEIIENEPKTPSEEEEKQTSQYSTARSPR